MRRAPAGPGARTRDLPRARPKGPQLHARGAGLDKQGLSVPIDRVGRLRNSMCCVVLEIVYRSTPLG